MSLIIDKITGQVFLMDAITISGGTSSYKFNSYTADTEIRLENLEAVSLNNITGITNAGSGVGLAIASTGHIASIKSLIAGSNITLTPTATGVRISSTGGGGGGGSGTITGATNGLSLSSDGLKTILGGDLTGSTTIGLKTFNLIFTATTGTLKYGSNLSSYYTARSLVDYGSVTGITSTLLSKTLFNTYSATTSTRLTTIETNYVTGGTNIGSGNGLFTSVSGKKTQFKSLVAGNNVTLTPSSTGITISSTGGYNVVVVTASTYSVTQTAGELIILCDTTANSITINLNNAVGNKSKITVKKINNDSNNITVDGFSTQTIDGGLNATIFVQYAAITMINDNANWLII